MTENEDRYATFQFIIRERSTEEGESWFDVISDLLSENCEPILNEEGEEVDCTCGLVSGGGYTGTLDGCYDHMRISEKWASVEVEDLKRILKKVAYMGLNDEEREAFNRLKEEAYWHDNFQTWLDNLPEDEEDDNQCECVGEARCVEHFLEELDEEDEPLSEDNGNIIKGDW